MTNETEQKGIFDVSDLEEQIKILKQTPQEIHKAIAEENTHSEEESERFSQSVAILDENHKNILVSLISQTLKERQRIKALVEQYYVPRKDFDNMYLVSRDMEKQRNEIKEKTLAEVKKVLDDFWNERKKQAKEHADMFGKGKNRDIDEREKFVFKTIPYGWEKELKKRLGIKWAKENGYTENHNFCKFFNITEEDLK